MGKKRTEPTTIPLVEALRSRGNLRSGEEVCLVEFENGYLPVLWNWHLEHCSINFPTQKPSYARFCADVQHGSGDKLIALVYGEPAGFIWYDINYNEYEENPEVSIRYVHTDPKWRGKGLATFMLEQAHEEMGWSASVFILGTHVDNTNAIKLYEKLGYKPYRLIMRRG